MLALAHGAPRVAVRKSINPLTYVCRAVGRDAREQEHPRVGRGGARALPRQNVARERHEHPPGGQDD
eukprot:175547-Pyramimonas_sp.AAC.1